MKIRPIKPGHIVYCSWCKAEGLRLACEYHLTGANRQSCAYHLPELESIRADALKLDRQDYSEADYQSWVRV